jgi:hypothetical protein
MDIDSKVLRRYFTINLALSLFVYIWEKNFYNVVLRFNGILPLPLSALFIILILVNIYLSMWCLIMIHRLWGKGKHMIMLNIMLIISIVIGVVAFIDFASYIPGFVQDPYFGIAFNY